MEIRDLLFGVVTFGFIVLVSVSLYVLAYKVEDAYNLSVDKKAWNNGYCTQCNKGSWEYEEAVGHKGGTTYIYVCNECETHHEFYHIMEEVVK